MDLWKAVQIVIQRKSIFLAVFFLALVAVVLIPRSNTEIIYQSSAKILLTPPSGMNDRQVELWFADEVTLRELVTSERLLKRAVERLSLEETWDELRESVVLDTPETFRYRGRSKVTLFFLRAESPDPEKAQAIAAELVDGFVDYVQELSAQEFANTRRYLEELVAEAKEKVEDSEEKLLQITANKSITESEYLLESETTLEHERLKLKEKTALLETEVGAIDDYLGGRTAVPPWSIISQKDQMIAQLENAVSKERLALVELQETYTNDSHHVKNQLGKVKEVEGLYQGQLNSVVSSLFKEKNAALSDSRQQLRRVNTQLLDFRKRQLTPEEKRAVAKLERKLNMWEDSHLSLVKQLYEARVVEQSARRQGAIQVLEKPSPGKPATSQSLPSLVKSLAIGIPFSLFAGLGVVLGLEYLNSTVQFVPHVEEVLQLPVLVSIPFVPDDLSTEWEQVKTQTWSEDESSTVFEEMPV